MTSAAKVPQRRMFELLFLCRDAFHAAVPERRPRDLRYLAFCNWVLSHYEQHGSESDNSVLQLLQSLVPNNDITLYSVAQFRTKLKQETYRQNYSYVFGADMLADEVDSRVRDLLLHLLAKGRDGLPVPSLGCTFFCQRGVGPQPKLSTRRSPFYTCPATPFQKLLFLTTVCSLRRLVDTKWKRNKRRRVTHSQTNASVSSAPSSSSTPFIPDLHDLKRPNAQRIGYAVQRVTEAWDTFAQYLNSSSCEQLLLPYIIFSNDTTSFRAIEQRTDGFLPYSQLNSLDVHMTPTLVAVDTFPAAHARGSVLDADMRTLAKLFLQQIHDLTHSTTLYAVDAPQDWRFLQRFNVNNADAPVQPMRRQKLPACFNAMDGELLSRLEGFLAPNPTLTPSADDDSAGAGGSSSTGASSHRNSPTADVTPRSPRPSQVVPFQAVDDEQLKLLLPQLREAMGSYVEMFNCSFEDLLLEHESETPLGVRNMEGAVQFIVTDPPYNIRRKMRRSNSDYDSLTEAQMAAVVEVCAKLLRPGGHAVIMCAVQQFSTWHSLFAQHRSTPQQQPPLDNPPPVDTFCVSTVPIILTALPHAYNSFPRSSCKMMSSAEFAVHVKKNGLRYAAEKTMVNYHSFNYVQSTFPGFKNVINNVPALLPGEQVRVPRAVPDGEPPKTQALRPEQKPLALLKELICRFSQQGDLVVDLFSGTFSTAVAAFSLPQHRRFVGCELDTVCFQHAADSTLRRFASAVHEGLSDIRLNEPLRVVASRIAVHYAAKPMGSPTWRAPDGMPQYQTMPAHLVAHLASICGSRTLLADYSASPVHRWPRSFRTALQQTDVLQLRGVDAAACGVMVMPSTVKHAQAGLGLFAARCFQPGDAVCTYFGTLVYHNLGQRTMRTKLYGEGALGVNVARFNTYAFQVRCTASSAFSAVRHRAQGMLSVHVVPPEFCVGSFINDHRYSEKDSEQKVQSPFIRVPNVRFCQTPATVNEPSQLLPHALITVKALQVINPGEELFLDYGKRDFVTTGV